MYQASVGRFNLCDFGRMRAFYSCKSRFRPDSNNRIRDKSLWLAGGELERISKSCSRVHGV